MKAKKIYFVLLAFFALAFAGCKTKNNSPIAGCVVDTSVNPIAVFSDADGNERTDCEMPVPTKLSVIEQKGNLLNVKFSDGKPKKSGWVQLEDVSLNAEIFDKMVNLALDGDENAQMLFEHGFPRFTNEEAIARLSPILERIGTRLQNADRSAENDKRIFLVLKEFIDAKCKPNETNPLHLLTPYANEETLDWFDQNDMDVPDSDGRTCLMIAVKNENLKAVNYFYKYYKHTNYSELDHKDNEGRTIVDYIDSCKNTEIKEILALCRYNVENLI
ncbi:MAG: ankyrin repeat domain-containing protein, partial [Treponema sp.]|nr:ankyrin repeat domain-containing protein [Treponema sp.]